MSTAVLPRFTVGARTERRALTGTFDSIRVIRPLAIGLATVTLGVTAVPIVLAMLACAVPLIPFVFPLLLMSARGVPWWPRQARASHTQQGTRCVGLPGHLAAS